MHILNAETFELDTWEIKFPFGRYWKTADDKIVLLLTQLSRSILKNQEAKKYPDLITFGFFCRKSNIKSEIHKISNIKTSVGWGTVLHIAPSNIPINFAYSLVMGLLSGNSNIVRLPSRIYPQNDIFLKLLSDILSNNIFSEISTGIRFIQTDHKSKKLDEIILRCDGLTVWGSDQTVKHFKQLPKKPRCVEIYFPNRSSSTVISAQCYVDLSLEEKNKIAHLFFNDTYLVDQNACSSPTIVFWLGSKAAINEAKVVFWKKLADELNYDYSLDPVAKIDKILDVMHICQAESKALSLSIEHPDICVINEECASKYSLRFGVFAEINIDNLDQIISFLRPNEQTLTTLGIDSHKLFDILTSSEIINVDRIMPIGQALDIGLQWDGKKIVDILSRKVEVR